MKLLVISHKLVWRNSNSSSGFATDGGFPFQMNSISQLFEKTIIAVPALANKSPKGEILMEGKNLSIYPLSSIKGSGILRKLRYIPWMFVHVLLLNKLINEADAVHVPIPSDIGTLGMILAKFKNKRLFVRYCGNWNYQSTKAEKLWKGFMERFAGGNNVMLATGLQGNVPSVKNRNIHWIFSSSLTKEEIDKLTQKKPLLDPKAPKLIIVCRMVESKGVKNLIDSIKILKERFPKIHLYLVGDGEDLEKFKDYVIGLDINENITFEGKLNHEDVITALQNAHIFCFPSKSEGFPKAVLEALACGLPVVANPISAIPELLNSGAGILLENDQPETIAFQVLNILHNPNQYLVMQNEGLNIASKFSLENWRDTIKLYLEQAWGTI